MIRTIRSRRRVFGRAEIQPGWLVVDVDGRGVGSVKALVGEFLAVSRGFAMAQLHVPLTAVRQVVEGRVILNLAAAAIDEGRWSERPRGI